MKIKKGDLKIETSSLVNIEWRNKIPRLIVHEKYEKTIKWILTQLADLDKPKS